MKIKLGDLQSSVAAVAAILTAFFAVAGYLSVRIQSNSLGLPHSTLSNGSRYVLEAVAFASSLVLLALIAATVIALLRSAQALLKRIAPRIYGAIAHRLHWVIRFSLQPALIALMALLGAIWSVAALLGVDYDQAIGELKPTEVRRDDFRDAFFALALWLMLCLKLASRSFTSEAQPSKNSWDGRGSAVLGIAVMALALPLLHGIGIREPRFVRVRALSATQPDRPVCGLLIERDEKRVAIWTAKREGSRIVTLVQDLGVEGATLELGPLVDMRGDVTDLLSTEDPNRLCEMSVRDPALGI